MRLQVKNLGPIKKGEIDLDKRFYVFVGYNNSGKTYMSQVMNTLWQCYSLLYYRKATEQSISIKNLKNITITDEILNKAHKEIQDRLIREVKQNFRSNNNQFSNLIISFLHLKDFFKSLEFKYYVSDYSPEGEQNQFYLISKDKESLNLSIELNPEKNNINLQELHIYDNEYEIVDILTIIFNRNLFKYLHSQKGDPYFLPANRLFLANFYKHLFAIEHQELNKLRDALFHVQSSNEIKINSEFSYTSDVSFLLNQLFKLSLPNNQPNLFYQDLIDELKEVIGGDILNKSSNKDISSIGTFKLKIENSEELDLHLSSSSVNQLITLYLYFKYWASESNNVLIIDEPEENLHPKNQLALLNILMKFANRNDNKVIITTHSPLMTDAVNNHLHLGYLAKKYEQNIESLIEENNFDLDAEAALSHDDIGIYFFDGKSIKEYSVEEYGVDFKDFRKEQEKVEEAGDKLRGLILKQEKLKRQECL